MSSSPIGLFKSVKHESIVLFRNAEFVQQTGFSPFSCSGTSYKTMAEIESESDGHLDEISQLCHNALSSDYQQLASAFKSLPKELVEEAGQALRVEGSHAFAKSNYNEALRSYSHALIALPGDARLLSNISACYMALNQPTPALTAARACVVADPNWGKAYYRLGTALQALDKKEEAFQAFKEALRREPGDKALIRTVGALQIALQRETATTRFVEQALNSAPQSEPAPPPAPTGTDSIADESLYRPTYCNERIRTNHEAMFQRNRISPHALTDAASRGLSNLIATATTVNSPRRDLAFWSALVVNNPAYMSAIKQAVGSASQRTPQPVMLHVGTGLAIAAPAATRYGAHVLAFEPRPHHRVITRRIMALNCPTARRLHVHPGPLTDAVGPPGPASGHRSASATLCLARPADILLLDTLDCGGLGLRILPLVRHAFQAGLLQPSAIVMPARLTIFAALAEYQTTSAGGFDFRHVNKYRWAPGYLSVQTALDPLCRLLTAPIPVFDFALDSSLSLTTIINSKKSFSATVLHCIMSSFVVHK